MSVSQRAPPSDLHSMYAAASKPPKFWLQVDCMKPSDDFRQRSDKTGQWQPPRPLHSNILDHRHTTNQWYEYDGGQTRLVHPFNPHEKKHYKTFSFYFDNDYIWIYKDNAITNAVGDGSGNPRLQGLKSSGGGRRKDESSSESNGDKLDDWMPLTFAWSLPNDITQTSKATTRATEHTLHAQRPNQAWIPVILPDRYHAPPERHTTTTGNGGLIADLPTLIALVTYSVRPEEVHNALLHCLGRTYNLYHRPRGRGWTPRRGLVVRIVCELDGNGKAAESQEPMSAQSLRLFEEGRFPGYGKFFD